MRCKTNISAILIAFVVLFATNGVVVFEHICNSSNLRDFSILTNTHCEMEKPIASCCAKKGIKKKDCCEHKQFFSKLSYDGFTAKQQEVKSIAKEICLHFLANNFLHLNQQIFERYYSGIPPPDNLFSIKYLLKPSPIKLQIFRC
ncbi:MAG TPA: hypothetical protein PK431_04335 [Chitinophagales bacterium]|nr:hypothetical protein [Chitinophagales bacterium]